MSKRVMIFITCGVICVCICIVSCVGLFATIGGGVFFLTKPVADTGSNFMKAVRAEDYEAAYALCAPSLQDEMGGVDGLRAHFVEYGLIPKKWSFNHTSIVNNTGTMTGSVTLADGEKRSLELNFVKVNGKWRIAHFKFQ